ncbi:MAG: enoyl-CoA hydratase/isomerase family protein [Leptospira sp.]|nr:enoyl-CoA hydratase/isomerase family protein [Leptospira sp.]
MEFKFLKFEIRDGVDIIEIFRPDALNALNEELLIELEKGIIELEKKEESRVFILTGSGKAFVAGADISKMKNFDERGGAEFSGTGQRVFNRIQNSNLVSIAAINGFALGGGMELALACDIRIASNAARMGLPEVSLGLIPGFGGTQRLSRLVGIGKANELIMTGDMLSAEEAYRIGAVNRIASPEELISTSIAMAKTILTRGPRAVRVAKRVIREGLDLAFEKGLELEKKEFGGSFGQAESGEGLAAFLEKRKPNF